jgi:hypothetical protein
MYEGVRDKIAVKLTFGTKQLRDNVVNNSAGNRPAVARDWSSGHGGD